MTSGNSAGLDAWRRVDQLVRTLEKLVERDPDQEVTGIAIPALDAVISQARSIIPDDPVVGRMADIFSVDLIEHDAQVRAADALIVATQLRAALDSFRRAPRHEAVL